MRFDVLSSSRGLELLDPTDPRAEIWLPPQHRPDGGRLVEKPEVPPSEPETLPSASGD